MAHLLNDPISVALLGIKAPLVQCCFIVIMHGINDHNFVMLLYKCIWQIYQSCQWHSWLLLKQKLWPLLFCQGNTSTHCPNHKGFPSFYIFRLDPPPSCPHEKRYIRIIQNMSHLTMSHQVMQHFERCCNTKWAINQYYDDSVWCNTWPSYDDSFINQ